MKGIYSITLLLLIILFSSLFTSCGKDRWEFYYPMTRHSLWIDSVMRDNYLWNDELADEDDLTSSYFLNSVSFLSKVKYGSDPASYVDTACSVPLTDYGYELVANLVNDTAMMVLITYIEPTSVASTTGLQRGEWIMAVDDQIITANNIDLLSDGDTHKLTIGHYTTISVYDEDSDSEEEQEVILYDRVVSLPTPTGYFSDNLPVVSIVNDHVGYMLYNHIAEANQQKVAAASQSLASGGITDMVIDLRFASTGDVQGFQYLASVLAPSSALGTQLATVQYAESRHMDSSLPFLTASELGNGVNLNLSTLYVLTSSNTAGPAEMLINCLKTVMNVVIIGEATQGIGVACETYSNPSTDQVLHLAACHVTDINDAANYLDGGFTPDYSVTPLSPVKGVQPFGSANENLLAKALELIE
ncbi:MAG: hypothetical protein K5856_07690 [Bacteroidaceae bacterium]|nr:hypothetical protein [Bacteroidaceae bacterium]